MHNIPNLISVVRLLLVPLTVWLLISGAYGYAFTTFVVAGVSDGLDGYLAKPYRITELKQALEHWLG